MKQAPRIFTFYSFKGGVGRSMAVLNLAYALAAKGRHVLVLDMDLEAPGLSGFLYRNREITGCGRFDILDLVGWASSAPLPLDPQLFPPMTDFVTPIDREKLGKIPRILSDLGHLDIIPVDEERDYYERLTSLAMRDYDQEALVRTGSIIRSWLKNLRFPIEIPDYYGPDFERTAPYDYVFVDSRTGITETGGLCVGPLSDSLVVITAMNDQNVVGTRGFLREIGILEASEFSQTVTGRSKDEVRRGIRSKPYLIVASLIPSGEIDTKKARLDELERSLGPVAAKLSYHPQLALKETIFTRDHPDEYLTREYEILLQGLMRTASDGVEGDVLTAALRQPRESRRFPSALKQLVRCAWQAGVEQALHALLSSAVPAEISDETEFMVWDQVCRTLIIGRTQHSKAITMNWANFLSYWSLRSADPTLSQMRLDEAMNRYLKILESDKSTPREKALALLNRGVIFSERGDRQSAILDYTSVIGMESAGVDQRAMGLVNRATMYGMTDQVRKAVVDCAAVIQMDGAPLEQKSRALLYRGASFSMLSEPEKAIADFTNVIRMPNVTPAFKSSALSGRALAFGQLRKHESAIADCVALIQMTEAPSDARIQAMLHRADLYRESEQLPKAIEDYTAVIELTGVPAETKSQALLSRAVAHDLLGEREKAVADYTEMVERHDTPVTRKTDALFFRGLSYHMRDKEDEAIADYTRVIQAPAVPADRRTDALFQRALIYSRREDDELAITDFTSIIKIPDAPPGRKASALLCRGLTFRKRDQRQGAIADLSELIEMPNVPSDEKARALLSRASMYVQERLVDSVSRDLTAVIELDDAPAELRAAAMVWRASNFREQGDLESAASDYSAVIDMPNAPTKEKATALGARGWIHYIAARYDDAINDDLHAISLSPGECTILGNLALAFLMVGRTEDASAAYADALVLADLKQLEAMATDLREVIDKHASISGADLSLTRVTTRLAMLRKNANTSSGRLSSRGLVDIHQVEGVDAVH